MFDQPAYRPIARLIHVVSVFEHQGKTLAVGGFYGVIKQWWHYEIIDALDAELNKYWPDGEMCPRPEIQAMLDSAAVKR